MAAPLSPTKLLVCPNCEARLPAADLRPGQKCRCGKCGKLLRVPGDDDDPGPPTPEPQTFGFNCRVCDTRLVALSTNVGKKVRCPDCGARNDIPHPPKPEVKQTPDAMFGQQYGLWNLDDAPSTDDLLAQQPKLLPVHCRVCDTLMYAQEKQVGHALTCPDCGAKTRVSPPRKEKPKQSVLVPDGEEYQLEEPEIDLDVFDTPEFEPEPEPEEPRRKTHREELKEEFGERPELPAIPLVQGVGKVFFRLPLPGWWLGLSFVGTISAVLLAVGLGGAIGSEFAALFAVSCVASGAILGALTFLAFATLLFAILTDSAEGNDKLYNAPDFNPIEWFGGGIYVALAIAMSCMPGALIGGLAGDKVLGALISEFLLYPIVLMSMLEIGSPIGVLSPRILLSVVLRPLHWLFFYVVTAAIGVPMFYGLSLLPQRLEVFVLAVPVVLALEMLYFRLLGRLAWWLSESLPAEESVEAD